MFPWLDFDIVDSHNKSANVKILRIIIVLTDQKATKFGKGFTTRCKEHKGQILDRESFDPNKVIDFWIIKSNEVLHECKLYTEFTITGVKIPIIQRV